MFIGGLNWETTDRKQDPLSRIYCTSFTLTDDFIESLKEYFSQFGEVQECTVMRDGASGRSRGFGFLTFRNPRDVNAVMVKEHYLDGKIVRPDISTSTNTPFHLLYPRSRQKRQQSKSFAPNIRALPSPYFSSSREEGNASPSTFSYFSSSPSKGLISSPFFSPTKIDPKRAIPRDEQERTAKIFVGGVSQDATETIFKEYFAQYGRVVDATLMMDKDTGRPRGFGFVTFDSESAVDNTLNGDLTILGKPIEVKKAQPRGNMREDEDVSLGRGGQGGGRNMRGGRNNNFNDRDGGNNNNQNNNNQMSGGVAGGMTPQMMAQYWAKMQQYFATMQQQMAMGQIGGMQAMGGMNPAMMQQMQQMQQMKAMQMAQQQQLQQQQQNQTRGSASPMPDAVQSPGESGNNQNPAAMMQAMQGMNPAMMQQMGMNPVMLAQMQAQMAGASNTGSPGPPSQPGANRHGTPGGTPGFNAQDQLLFEQQKYEQQQAQRGGGFGGGPTSWEGMYEDVPQPGGGGGQGGFGGRGRGGYGGFRGGGGGGGGGGGPQPAPPANAPTGPKNAGRPGANWRGGGRGSHRGGFHPYQR